MNNKTIHNEVTVVKSIGFVLGKVFYHSVRSTSWSLGIAKTANDIGVMICKEMDFQPLPMKKNGGSTELAMQNRIAKPQNDCCEAVCGK
jgi:hypothetical protein